MNLKFLVVLILALGAVSASSAQALQKVKWKAYGVQFNAPVGFVVEDDSEDGYIISTKEYYITVQLLEGDGIKRSELAKDLKNVATDDDVTQQTKVESFETPQFYVVWLKGNCETDQCMYSYLLDKKEGTGFYLSVIYQKKTDEVPLQILKSFQLFE